MKKSLLALVLVASLIVAMLCSCVVTPTTDDSGEGKEAKTVFTIDVNPSIKIYADANDKVINVEAENEDGEKIVAELDFENLDLEKVVENAIDKMCEKGYIEGEYGDVLISFEKNAEDVSEKINKKINEAFEKHGKEAGVIEQKLNDLDKEAREELEKFAKENDISVGKARLIEKIREEFPELDDKELCELKVKELKSLLNETSEHTKKQFEKIDQRINEELASKEEAINAAIESLEIALEEGAEYKTEIRTFMKDGELVYNVEIIYGEEKYEITLDAKTIEILETEVKKFEEFDPEKFAKDYMDKHGIDKDSLKEHFKGEYGDLIPDEIKIELTPAQAKQIALMYVPFASLRLEKTDVEVHETEEDTFFVVTIELEDDSSYEVVIEASSLTVVKLSVNGEEVTIPEISFEIPNIK